MKSASPEVYFHLGLGKTGTTFLQYRAFPYFEGFEYIQRTKYRRAKEIIKASQSGRFFLSFECDQQLEHVAKDWALNYPDTRPILVFRRHDSWIASQFRRFLKNCNVTEFRQLFDLNEDQGKFKKKDLLYVPMVDMLRREFSQEPIVLLYDDMKKDPKAFISDLAKRMGSAIDIESLDFSAKHSSYSDRQLAFLMRVSRIIPLRNKVVYSNRVVEFLRKTRVSWTRYLVLFIGKFWPDLGNSRPLVSSEELNKVREYYADDWKELTRISQDQKDVLTI